MSALAQEHRAFVVAMRSASEGGLAIYRRSIENNHRDALAAAYPVIQRLVGEAFFAETARAYARAFPSKTGNLHDFGDRLGDFLASYAPAARLAYLPDVAAYEWARHRAGLAADMPAFDFGALARVPRERWGDVRLVLHPSVALLEATHAVTALWEANQEGRDGTVEEVHVPERLVAWRDRANAIQARQLRDSTWRLLQAFAAGESLASGLEGWGDPEPIGACLGRFAGEGVIAACVLD